MEAESVWKMTLFKFTFLAAKILCFTGTCLFVMTTTSNDVSPDNKKEEKLTSSYSKGKAEPLKISRCV